MKKQLLLLVSCLAFLQIGLAQDNAAAHRKNKNFTTTALKQGTTTVHTGAVIFSDDFSTPANWTISNQAGNTDDWTIGTAGPAGTYAIPAIASTSAANGFALFDSDLLCSGNQIADLTTATSFNCTGHPSVELSFEENYRRFDDSTYVLVSNDNVNWTIFPVNATFTNNVSAVNPTTVTVDISSVASNQATVWVRFEFYSPSSIGTAPGCGYSWMVDDVSVFDGCAAPVVTAVTNIVCPGSTVDLSFTPGVNQTYQWQSSPDNITFTNIAGATGTTYTATITADTYFRIISTCSGSLTGTSEAVKVIPNPTAPLCYCIPYNFACNNVDDFITDVSITGTTLTNSSTCSALDVLVNANYSFYPTSVTTATLHAGSTYDINVTTGASNSVSLWIDYDNNGTFDTYEWTDVVDASTAATMSTMSFTVPANATQALTGLRLRSRLATFVNDSTYGCLSMGSGETEDYFVTIAAPLGIHENLFAKASIVPSVTSDLVHINLGNVPTSNTTLRVYDNLGHVVMTKKNLDRQTLDLNLGSFESGLYIVRVENGTSTFNGKVTLSK